ncbi:NAD kinase [Ignavigranum ruoffiae]|uniref:NAD kinase n=1 Tax=Ignavigranum ruoffiae TaxID=89093 RepID=A0A1H9FWB4_9LACT|nr:NAD kinase [Ignavigranum ruoffiae]UPQ85849.1 NAD kinase [Ignavigranum ruoffiae]SEQ42181.1 NAD+ kinase [Ignavigranum ruoffiae]
MLTVLLYANDKQLSQALKKEFIQKIKDQPIRLVEEKEQADYIITIGGDGTLLSAFHRFPQYLEYSQFIGIHTGHLGFYADWLANGIDQLIRGLVSGNRESVSYPLLTVDIKTTDKRSIRRLALNEFVLRSTAGTVVCDVYLDDFCFETFRGDGICISTPTGSTGLNKSLGGAVIHPKLDAMQMTEIASINNLIYRTLSSPVIVPQEESITLKPDSQSGNFILSLDNQSLSLENIESIRTQIAPQRIRFASLKHTHFWDRVASSFIGNHPSDSRELNR